MKNRFIYTIYFIQTSSSFRQSFKIIVGFLLFFALSSFHSENIRFDYLNVSNGLSQNSVTALAQDSIGRIWIGTRDGLNVYDGTKIKIFRQIRANSNSLLGHFVNDIKIYGNNLWVVTKSGVSHLNISNSKFETFPKQGVISIIQYNGVVFVGTKTGMLTLDENSKSFQESPILPNYSVSVTHFNIDKSQTLWISTSKGVFAHFKSGIIVKVFDCSATVTFIDKHKQLWIGTSDNGVFVLNNKRQVFKHFVHDNSANSIPNNLVRDIEHDVKGNIWIGTFKGLSVVNSSNFSIQNFTNDDKREKSLSQNSIYALLRDKQNGIWIGTFFGGINYFNHDVYSQYEIVKEGDRGTSSGVIGEMLEDNNANLWIATEGGGLNYLNRKTGKFTHYQHVEGKPGLSQDIIRSLYLKDKNTLLIGTHLGGLNVMDIKTGNIKTFLHNPTDATSIPSNIVRDILPYKGHFLLATDKGVVKYNATNQRFSLFFDKLKQAIVSVMVNCILEDSFGTLWFGTEDYGLFAYQQKTGVLKRYYTASGNTKSIGDNNISCMYEDHLFRLWIGTSGGGLNQYNREKDCFEVYNITTHNFPSNFILGIKESNYGSLWISTSKGLSLFDVFKNKVTNYSQKNGFPIDELNQNALYLSNNGELFVGGIHGLVSFNEKAILNQKQQHNMTFESLYVNNKEVLPQDDSEILENTLAFTDEIELKPGQNVFTIEYSACNYIKTSKNTYRYKLENFDVDWIEAGDQSSVTYTNLNPGSYTLRVQGLSGVKGAVIGEKSLQISVIPPIYRTWYAVVFYILLGIFIFLWVKRMYRNRIVLENRVKSEQREKIQINQLNQSKLEFFTNISHEFRTPLTLISGTLESILENPKTLKENQAKIISTHKNVLRLNNLVTELLDFRKLELGYNSLKVQEVNFDSFLDDIYKAFADYAKYHAIEFNYSKQSDVTLWLDKTQMEKVFYNLLSNAFKFVDDVHGKVSMLINETPDLVQVQIEDNGIGISKEKIDHIFDPYFQIDTIQVNPKRKGSGIGLALCKQILTEHVGEISVHSDENGTIFTIKLLKGNAHYKESDFATEMHEDSGSTLKSFDLIEVDETEISAELFDLTDNQHLSLLIVEDNAEARKLIRSIFESTYKIYEAEDGEEGVRRAIEIQPSVIISDVMMPKVTGTELCSKLKRNIQTSHIPIILLTAKATEEYKIEGLETGADDYITKPFSNKLLKAKVKNLINNRLLLQQKFRNDPHIKVSEVTSNSLDQKFLDQARAIVMKHIDQTEFVAQDFAREMGVGRSKLFDKIKGITGQTPNEFIVSIRLAKAAELLMHEHDELNISEIAYTVGFSTASYFSKCFKQHFGVTPTEYLINREKKV